MVGEVSVFLFCSLARVPASGFLQHTKTLRCNKNKRTAVLSQPSFKFHADSPSVVESSRRLMPGKRYFLGLFSTEFVRIFFFVF